MAKVRSLPRNLLTPRCYQFLSWSSPYEAFHRALIGPPTSERWDWSSILVSPWGWILSYQKRIALPLKFQHSEFFLKKIFDFKVSFFFFLIWGPHWFSISFQNKQGSIIYNSSFVLPNVIPTTCCIWIFWFGITYSISIAFYSHFKIDELKITLGL